MHLVTHVPDKVGRVHCIQHGLRGGLRIRGAHVTENGNCKRARVAPGARRSHVKFTRPAIAGITNLIIDEGVWPQVFQDDRVMIRRANIRRGRTRRGTRQDARRGTVSHGAGRRGRRRVP